MIDISIVVPVFEHWNLVPALLNGLERQTVGASRFELILVDNGSKQLPDGMWLPSWARLLKCDVPGSYAARNVGVSAANGRLVAFTDADCVPSPEWLERGWEAWLEGRDKVLVAGGVSIEPADWSRLTVAEMFDVALGLPQRRYVGNGYAVTANLMIPRRAFDEVGLFDQKRFSGGDAEFCRRAAKCGWTLKYCAAAEVVHPARRELHELTTKQRRVVGGQLRAGSILRRAKYGVLLVLPPFQTCVLALVAKRLSWSQRLRVCTIVFLLRIVALGEMIRLMLGAPPVRR